MNYASSFPNLPDDAHLWVHVADRPLQPDEHERLAGILEHFLDGWTSHARPVQGAFRFAGARILLVAAALPDGAVSGCGIDKLIRQLEASAQEMGFAWASPLAVFYRDAEGAVQQASRPAFATLAREGTVTTETPVLDPSVSDVGALRSGAFEQSAGQSWHAQAFPLEAPTVQS